MTLFGTSMITTHTRRFVIPLKVLNSEAVGNVMIEVRNYRIVFSAEGGLRSRQLQPTNKQDERKGWRRFRCL
jgi:hypothetical protein